MFINIFALRIEEKVRILWTISQLLVYLFGYWKTKTYLDLRYNLNSNKWSINHVHTITSNIKCLNDLNIKEIRQIY